MKEKIGQLGIRCYPSNELNEQMGLDAMGWLAEGLIDFCVPMLYIYFVLDSNMPIDWLVKAAHENGTSVYLVLQPYYTDGGAYTSNPQVACQAYVDVRT
jgi:hypothetical protein